MYLRTSIHIVHPESFRSNTQIAIVFARKNRPRVNRNGEFACVYLHSRTLAFTSTVRDRPRMCVRLFNYYSRLACVLSVEKFCIRILLYVLPSVLRILSLLWLSRMCVYLFVVFCHHVHLDPEI